MNHSLSSEERKFADVALHANDDPPKNQYATHLLSDEKQCNLFYDC